MIPLSLINAFDKLHGEHWEEDDYYSMVKTSSLVSLAEEFEKVRPSVKLKYRPEIEFAIEKWTPELQQHVLVDVCKSEEEARKVLRELNDMSYRLYINSLGVYSK